MLTYLFYFALTNAVEYLVVQTVLGWKNHRLPVVVSVLVANAVTHPLAYLSMLYVMEVAPQEKMNFFFALEFVVPIVESVIAVYILKPYGFTPRRLIGATVLANLTSASLSFVHF